MLDFVVDYVAGGFAKVVHAEPFGLQLGNIALEVVEKLEIVLNIQQVGQVQRVPFIGLFIRPICIITH